MVPAACPGSIKENFTVMNKSVLTIVRLVFFSLMLVVLVVLMILNITERGIGTGMDKILLAPSLSCLYSGPLPGYGL